MNLFEWAETQPQSVAEECRRRFGRFEPGGGCIRIYAADMKTVVRTEKCAEWCPALNKKLD